MELQVVRTIHPVGQGAFYGEILHRPGINDDKRIVYDCGVMPLSIRLKEEIGNFLPKDSTIDVLFISHFHADHVNGIKLLAEKYKIKHLVLPQIDRYDWFYIVENYLTTGTADVNVVSDVQASVGDARVIEVAPVEENQNGAVSDEPMVLDDSKLDGSKSTIINGLSPIVIGKQDFVRWHYIVVNPLKKADLDALRSALENIDYDGRKLTIDDLHKPEVLTAIRKELQDAYSRVFKGGNEYSMCMLSELADRKDYYSYSRYNKRFLHCMDFDRYRPRSEEYRSYGVDGGLYCGDADFLHCDTLECLKQRLDGRERFVGLLQLPHHGSKENFNVDLLNWFYNLQVSFACYGSPNRYNHPSSDVMGTTGTYCYVTGVNQFKTNVLTERIEVYKMKEVKVVNGLAKTSD